MRTRRENCLLSSESPSFRAAEQIIRRLKSGRRPIWSLPGNPWFGRTGWWAHQGSNLGPDD